MLKIFAALGLAYSAPGRIVPRVEKSGEGTTKKRKNRRKIEGRWKSYRENLAWGSSTF